MFKRLRSLSLVYQLSLAVAVITLLVFSALTLYVSEKTAQDALAAVESELGREVELIGTNLEFFNETLVQQTNKLSDVFFGMFSPQDFEVDDQAPVKVGDYQAPTLRYRGEPINNDFSWPDKFTATTGGTATIFLRHNDDFLRISTSLRKQDGSRAFGTMLGSGHPGHAALLRGEAYMGPAELFGRHYMTKYTPIKDGAGKVTGILYVGFDFTDQFDALQNRIAEVRFGETGYPYAIDAKPGPKQGQLVMHPSLEGRNLLEIPDAAGNQVFRQLLDGEQGILHYQWRTGDAPVQDKIVAYRYVKGWDWVIAAGSYTAEFTRGSTALRFSLIAVSVISALLIVALTFLVLRSQLRPLAHIGNRMERLGKGDLSGDLEEVHVDGSEKTRNEVQLLARQVGQMTNSLRELISGVSSSMLSLTSAAQQVAQVAAQTNEGVKNQQTETDQVATAVNELAATVQEVAHSASSAADATRRADETAAQGGQVVRSVITSIEALASEVEQSAGVIARVERESKNIGAVLEVIRGIAEQTNLLALNAAIEAARAGEQGRGFAVVADEVRNLAQKTQASTTEINDMIARLQECSKEAVIAMEAGRSKAHESVGRAAEAGENLTEITGMTSSITGVTVQIAAAAEEQTAVAEEINKSVIRIRDIANTTAEGADEMGTATDGLQLVAQQLRTAVGRFRL